MKPVEDRVPKIGMAGSFTDVISLIDQNFDGGTHDNGYIE